MAKPIIDPEFHSLIPLLTDDERIQLEENIKAEGCRDALVVWEGILLDGHNRLEICERLGLPYKTTTIELPSREAAADWIDRNQLGRRNLTPDQMRLLRGRRYNRAKKTIGKPAGTIMGQNDPISTAERLAKEHGVSPATIKRDAKFAEEVAADPELQKAVREHKPVAKAKKEKNIQVRKKRLIEETKAAIVERPVLHALDCMRYLDAVPPIDLLLTDPPYFTDGDYTAQVSAYLERVKPTGQAYVFASADPAEAEAYLGMDSHHMALIQILVWNYNNTGQRQPNDRYNSNYQLIFYYRGPDAPAINKPGDGTHQYACQTINAPDGRIGDRFHEWQKPMELIDRLIRNSSKVGDFVFDPFAGTGTTMIAAATLGRKTAGCEIDKANAKICIERGCVHEP
jgi:hypothetical protein